MIKRRPRRVREVTAPCYFCKSKTSPDYKEVDNLRRYLSERGKILGRAKTGTCAKHQRSLTHALKRARHLALLPFVSRS